MLFLYTGTDRDAVRAALAKDMAARGEGRVIIRVTDAHTVADLSAALQGGGMFDGPRIVVFENVLQHAEMAPIVFDALVSLQGSDDLVYLLEEKTDATTRKRIEKYAAQSVRFDAAKGERDTAVFELGYAMQRADKKKLWVGYMRELAKGAAPEMLHGILFWAAKQQLLKAASPDARLRAAARVAALVELPHEARRDGFDMEYALEKFVLSIS